MQSVSQVCIFYVSYVLHSTCYVAVAVTAAAQSLVSGHCSDILQFICCLHYLSIIHFKHLNLFFLFWDSCSLKLLFQMADSLPLAWRRQYKNL